MKRSGLVVASVMAVLAAGGIVGCGGGQHREAASTPGTCLPASPQGSLTAQVTRPASQPDHKGATPMLAADLTVDCFDGSGPVRLATLTTPAVVNLWASWCPPCRHELPEVEAFARDARGQVVVIGVDSGDTRQASSPLITSLGLSYPMLYDRDSRLMRAIGVTALPATIFLDGRGGVAGVYNGPALDKARLSELTRQYLGVAG